MPPKVRSGALASGLLSLALTLAMAAVDAAPPAAAPNSGAAARQPAKSAAANADGIQWESLDPATRKALAPLRLDWNHLDSAQQSKWVEIAQRLPQMSRAQQQRIKVRMAEWSRMTPVERAQARLRFIQAQRTGGADREQRWGEYQALPNDQKEKFAERAAAPGGQKARPAGPVRSDRSDNNDGPAAKSNLVTNPNFGAQPRTIAPAMLKAGPGASTTMVSKTPAPPPHQQTGLPKIAASPQFVDSATLLPKLGAQGAATAASNDDDEQPTMVPRP